MTLLRILGLFVLFLITGVSCKDDDSLHPTPQPWSSRPSQRTRDHGDAGAYPGQVINRGRHVLQCPGHAGLERRNDSGRDERRDLDQQRSGSRERRRRHCRGLKVGTADITVTASNLTATLTVTVTDATLVTLSITPPSPTLALGLARQLKATGVFTDGTTQDLTKQVTWSSATKKVATVSREGLLTASAVGSTKISAKLGATSATTVVTVSPAESSPPSR